MLSIHLRLGLPSGLLPSGFPTGQLRYKILFTFPVNYLMAINIAYILVVPSVLKFKGYHSSAMSMYFCSIAPASTVSE
jgi:hypothetical protein